MKQTIAGIFIFLFIFSSATPVFAGTTPAEGQLLAILNYLERTYTPPQPLTDNNITSIINDSAKWILSAQKDDGSFSYEYHPFEDLYSADNNMVRQAGTFYMLAEIYRNQTKRDPSIREALESAVIYFESLGHEDKGSHGDFICVKNAHTSTRCDLGTSSLVLLGLLSFMEADPSQKTNYEDLTKNYYNYIMSARHEGRGFSDKYHVDTGFADTESTFYNGEAMLALVRYYQTYPDDEIQLYFDEVFTYLASEEKLETPLYLWMMAALKDAVVVWNNDAYIAYVERFTRERLNTEGLNRGRGHNYCAPLEGFVSAYSALEGSSDEMLRLRLHEAVDFWLAKVARLQLSEAQPYRLVKVDGTLTMLKLQNSAQAHGGFLTGEDELLQRIDFTQHCVSAFLQKHIDIDKNAL